MPTLNHQTQAFIQFNSNVICRNEHRDNHPLVHLEDHFTIAASQYDETEVTPHEEMNSTTHPDNSRQLLLQSQCHATPSAGQGSSTDWNTPQIEQNPTNTGHFVYL